MSLKQQVESLLAMPKSTENDAINRSNRYVMMMAKYGKARLDEAIAMQQAITIKQLKEMLNEYNDDLKMLIAVDDEAEQFAPLVFPISNYIKPKRVLVLRRGTSFKPKI